MRAGLVIVRACKQTRCAHGSEPARVGERVASAAPAGFFHPGPQSHSLCVRPWVHFAGMPVGQMPTMLVGHTMTAVSLFLRSSSMAPGAVNARAAQHTPGASLGSLQMMAARAYRMGVVLRLPRASSALLVCSSRGRRVSINTYVPLG